MNQISLTIVGTSFTYFMRHRSLGFNAEKFNLYSRVRSSLINDPREKELRFLNTKITSCRLCNVTTTALGRSLISRPSLLILIPLVFTPICFKTVKIRSLSVLFNLKRTFLSICIVLYVTICLFLHNKSISLHTIAK